MREPCRVLYVHTFYRSYLDDFYRKNPHMLQASFTEQMKTLVRDGFSAVHMVVSYLPGCKTQFVLANCHEAQGAWLKEKGCVLHSIDDWQNEIVRHQIADFKPDILYLGDCIRHQASFISSLPWRPPVIMSWRAADVPLGTDWTGFDVMLSGLPRLLAFAESIGAQKGVMFAPGMPSWIAREVEDIPQNIDVVFAGSVYPKQHVRRLALLETVAEAATLHGFSLALHMACDPALISPVMRPYVRPPVFGLEMHRILRRGRIIFDTRGSIGLRKPDGSYALDLAQEDTANMRLFEGTGGGSLVLTDELAGLARLFEPGKEVATFRDEQDLVDKILYYLAHSEEREAIAAAGKARCLGEWNMKNRARHFLDIAREVLAEKGL